MEDMPIFKGLANRIAGTIYAFMYFTSDRMLFGVTLLGWITVVLFTMALYLWLQSRSFTVFLFVLAGLSAIRILYLKAKRDGFIIFSPLDNEVSPTNPNRLENMHRQDVWASGVFSVLGREEHMIQRPAQMWRVPFGDHAMMVQRPAGRFLYQFIEAGYIQQIQAGYIIFGTQVNAALEVDFMTTWGPDTGESDFNWFSSSEGSEPKRLKRSIYLGFASKSIRDAIWHSLLQAANY
jgi:hypothetical protein